MKRDLSILSEYVRISTPDKDRLAELVVRAKGPELSMSQFAKKCEVNPSTLSRIVNKKTTGKNSDALIFNIAENADPNSGVTFEMLMSAHGMKKRNLNGKVDTEEYRAFEKNAADLVLSEIMKRGYKVQVPMTPQVYNALNYHYRPDWEIATDAVTSDNTMGQWLFEFWTMLGTEQQAIRKQTIKLRQKLLMVLGLYYMDEVKADKLSFSIRRNELKLFFDESGYSGCIMPNKNGQLFNDGQRHFVLGSVFVADKEDEIEILNKYRQFKNRFGFTGEIKGSELMTQRNNEALKYFITNVLDDKHFFICNYDKIFYLSTLISVYIFGVHFQQQETLTFYMMASALAGEKEELFLHYCSAVCENTDNSKIEFLEYLISFPYEKLDRNDYNLYIAFAKLMLENKDYGEFPLTYEAYSCKNTVNFVNMTALGELLLSLKHLHGVDMSKTEIYHDNLMGYEEEYNQSFEDNKIHINFVDSKENELVQLADNISSIYRKCFEKSFEAFRCNKQWTDNIWFTENYSRIINTIGMEHIKMDTQISDYVLPFVIRDIFGNEYGQFEQNKEKFWGLFYFYKERIMEDIDAIKVDLPL